MSRRDEKKQKKLSTKACSAVETSDTQNCSTKNTKACGTSKRCK